MMELDGHERVLPEDRLCVLVNVNFFFFLPCHLIINASSCNGDMKQKHRRPRLGWTKETKYVGRETDQETVPFEYILNPLKQ